MALAGAGNTFRDIKRGVVIRHSWVISSTNWLKITHVVVFVKHDDCARRQAFQRAVNDFDAVVFETRYYAVEA
ncbi:hypothetical protein KCP69_16515 [Salmonella enterica subsp. enterica]|nr:hypothetical protein KCP69_16515 [Salmonella enterica subsp. enterica]